MLRAVAVAEAGGGTSTNGTSSDTQVRPRKRVRHPETWKRNMARAKRAKGEEYVSPSTGELVPARETAPACKCKRKCYDAFTEDERTSILQEFNGLANKELQDSYLFGLISTTAIKRRRPRGSSGKAPPRAMHVYRVSIVCSMSYITHKAACGCIGTMCALIRKLACSCFVMIVQYILG